MAGGERQCQALPILSLRIDGEQALARAQRLLAIPALVELPGLQLKQACGNCCEVGAFPSYPVVERLDIEVKPGQELTTVETEGTLRIASFLGKHSELVCIRREQLRVQADQFAIENKQAWRHRVQLLAQCEDALAQALARLLVEAVAPQQRCQLLALQRRRRQHRQIRQQRTALA